MDNYATPEKSRRDYPELEVHVNNVKTGIPRLEDLAGNLVLDLVNQQFYGSTNGWILTKRNPRRLITYATKKFLN